MTVLGSAENIARLRAASGFVFDLDGSLVLGDKHNRGLNALPRADDTLKLLDSRGIPWVILTNGTVRVPANIADALREAGLDVDAEKILTPATVAAEYFLQRKMQRILVLGIEGVWQPLRDAGLDVMLPDDQDLAPETADAVFVGWYRQFHMEHIEAACEAVWNGAKLYGASMVPFFATRTGRALGSSRAICAMITSVTGKRASALGKPSKASLRSSFAHLGSKPEDTVILGDDPDLEIAMARGSGALAVAVHSGVGQKEEFEAMPADKRPHISVASVAELYDLLVADE